MDIYYVQLLFMIDIILHIIFYIDIYFINTHTYIISEIDNIQICMLSFSDNLQLKYSLASSYTVFDKGERRVKQALK